MTFEVSVGCSCFFDFGVKRLFSEMARVAVRAWLGVREIVERAEIAVALRAMCVRVNPCQEHANVLDAGLQWCMLLTFW